MVRVILEILFVAFSVTAICELISWFVVYKSENYVSLVNQMNKFLKTVQKNKNELQDSAATQQKKLKKKTSRVEDQLKMLYNQLAPFNLRLAIVNMVILIGAYQVILTAYDGMVVAKLPFVPFSIFTNLTHRGLKGENYSEASAHLFFAMGLLFFRTNLQKFLEFKNIRPIQPNMMNLLFEWQSQAMGLQE